MSVGRRVVIADFINDDLAIEREILAGVAEVEALDCMREEQLWPRVDEADAVMLYHCLGISRATIERLKCCRLIVRCGVGFDNVDWAFARERGIPVANVPDYGTEEVADSAIGMALSLTRGIHLYNSRLRAERGDWMYTQAAPVYRLRGRTFGIVGLGRIGAATAERAKALGMNVVFYDPYRADGWDKALGVRRVESLAELLSISHILSLHCPLTPETQHLMNASTIAQMPRGSFLINTARGGVVDVDALPAALASGQLAGAAIDVLEQEPPIGNQPLLAAWKDPAHPAHDRLILNPHAAFYSQEGLQDMRVKGAHACRRALLGESLRNIVN
jgi:D-3-phosphoglycerate dehydrogenase/C-terminal binding protein